MGKAVQYEEQLVFGLGGRDSFAAGKWAGEKKGRFAQFAALRANGTLGRPYEGLKDWCVGAGSSNTVHKWFVWISFNSIWAEAEEDGIGFIHAPPSAPNKKKSVKFVPGYLLVWSCPVPTAANSS